jgi:hypothetical protein
VQAVRAGHVQGRGHGRTPSMRKVRDGGGSQYRDGVPGRFPLDALCVPAQLLRQLDRGGCGEAKQNNGAVGWVLQVQRRRCELHAARCVPLCLQKGEVGLAARCTLLLGNGGACCVL